MPTPDQRVTCNVSVTFFSMGRGPKAFLSQRKPEELCLFGNQYFQSVVFLFSAPNKGQDLYLENILFKSEYLLSFKISITGLKTIWRLQPPVPVLLLLCRQTYFSFAVVLNFYLFVQLLLQDWFDAIAQQKIPNCKDKFNDEKFNGFYAIKMTVFGNLR